MVSYLLGCPMIYLYGTVGKQLSLFWRQAVTNQSGKSTVTGNRIYSKYMIIIVIQIPLNVGNKLRETRSSVQSQRYPFSRPSHMAALRGERQDDDYLHNIPVGSCSGSGEPGAAQIEENEPSNRFWS